MTTGSSDQTQTRRPIQWIPPFTSLRYRNYRLFWFSSWAEHTGQYLELAAVLWLVHGMTGSPLILSLVGMSRYVPPIIFGYMGGILADRWDRRMMLVVALAWMGFFSMSLSILAYSGLLKVWHIVVICLLQSSAVSFNHPARQSIIPNLVKKEHLLNVIALNQFSVMGSRFVGMVAAGYLLAHIDVVPVIAARAAGNIFAILCLLLAKVPATPGTAKKKTHLRNLVEGLEYIRSNKIVLSLAALYLIPQFVTITAISLMPAFAKEILHIGAEGYGWLNGALSIGAFAATVIMASLYDFRHKGVLLLSAGMLMGIALLGFSLSPWFVLSLFFLLITGYMSTTFRSVNTTTIQTIIPDEMRGRVMSLRDVTKGLGSAAVLIAGAVGEWAGVPVAIGMLGVLAFTVFLLIALLAPQIRKIE